jgi:DNA-binding response OmpR family regulator
MVAPPNARDDHLPCALVVEDDQAVADVLCGMLEDLYQVVNVSTVEAALFVLGEQDIDVVLLDYHLSGESGVAVAERADLAKVPMVWMSGSPVAIEQIVALALPHTLLPKPFNTQGVLDALAKARELN